jgi:tripartite-type tricarboxylate transporter receptor subunit TctC
MARTSIATALALTAGMLAGPAQAADDAKIAAFYKDKKIIMMVGSTPGGGYDTYARLVSSHLGRFIPGNPTFVTQNKNGAGSIIAVNYVVNTMPKDGTVIVGLQRNAAMVQILGRKGPQFKAAELNWIGSLATEAGACVVTKRSGIKTFADLFTKQVLMAGFGPNDSELQPAMFNNTLGTRFKIISGYPGSPEAHIAVQRGEADGMCQSWSSFKQLAGKYYTDGNMLPIVQMGLRKEPELTKLGVPTVFDYIEKQRLPKGFAVDEVKTMYEMVFAAKDMGRPFAMAPGVPKERVEAIRTAFNTMVKDEKFLADAKRQKREVDVVTGVEIQKTIERLSKAPKSLLTKLEDSQIYKGVKQTAVIKYVKHSGEITTIRMGGRRLYLTHDGREVRANVSGSKTKITIAGKKAKRKAIKEGMTCTFDYPGSGTTARTITCTQ